MRDLSACLSARMSQKSVLYWSPLSILLVYASYQNLALTSLFDCPVTPFKARETAIRLQGVQQLILVTLRYIFGSQYC
jgi:hypothetical protein